MMRLMAYINKLFRIITPSFIQKEYDYWKFDESQIIYKDLSYRDYLTSALAASRPDITEKSKRILLKDIKKVYLTDQTRPDEYLLYGYDNKSKKVRDTYMPQRTKDAILFGYYGKDAGPLFGQIRDKYTFYTLLNPFFKRDVIKIETGDDLMLFVEFCNKHNRFICKILNSGCGVGVRIVNISDKQQIETLFFELIGQGPWIIEELIEQNPEISKFNDSSVNTVRFPSFRHGSIIKQDYPSIRFGRKGNIVDNAGQGGVFASIDINTGEIITNGFDELGHEYEVHPDSKIRFKGFIIPNWPELLKEAQQAHLALSEKQTYIAFDYALSDKGWVIVEGNWGDFILQQTALKRGLKYEFLRLLNG